MMAREQVRFNSTYKFHKGLLAGQKLGETNTVHKHEAG